MGQLTSIRIKGWKSIKEALIDFRSLNLLIGANGAGKSNLVSFFKMITEMRKKSFQVYIAQNGGADSFLHYGTKQTNAITADLKIRTDLGEGLYDFSLVPAVGEKIIFQEEKLTFLSHLPISPIQISTIGSQLPNTARNGHRESELDCLFSNNIVNDFDSNGKLVSDFLNKIRVYHFHDTSLFGPMRKDCPRDANRILFHNAANLPAMLYLYHQHYPTSYQQIVAAVKAVAPFFEDFELAPKRQNPKNIALEWKPKIFDHEFGKGTGTSDFAFAAHQLSDGTLRAIALFTLLLQPDEDFPAMIVLDEPELGLHPAALAVLADLIKSASRHCQIVVATQSTTLLDHFEADDIITVNQRDGISTFDRLDPNALKDWLAEYALSELWERNVIGGGPY